MVKSFLDLLRRDDVDGMLPYLSFAPGTSQARRLEIAAQFVDLLNAGGVIDLDKASTDVDGKLYDGLPPGVDSVGELKINGETVPLVIEQVSLTKENRKVWRFQKALMDQVPQLHETLEGHAFLEHLPSWLLTPQFLDVKAWQWLGLGFALFTAIVLGRVIAYLLMHLGRVLAVYFKFAMTGETLRDFLPSLSWISGITLFSVLRRFLELHLVARQYLGQGENMLLVLATGFFASRALHAGVDYYRRQFELESRTAAMSMLPPIEKGLRAVLVVVIAVALLSTSGFNVTALLAGLGVGGLAVALAGQKTIENLFGGVSVILDQPVRVGDFGKFGEVQGTIEDIGLRSTRVRTLDQTLVTIPNAEFSTMKLENFERRAKMRWAVRLGLRYDSPAESLKGVVDDLRQMLLDHPRVHNDPARVRFTNFGASSLDIDIFAFLNVQDPNEYWRIVEELNFRVLQIVESRGLSFAFPSTSVYLESKPQPT
jgi:MscS family membrane protein